MVINRLKKYKENLSKKRLAIFCLFMSSFFLPFGYDALFLLIMELTGSYWITDVIFYLISGVFFILYILLQKLHEKDNS